MRLLIQLLILLGLSSMAEAEDMIIERAILQDKTGNLAIDQITQQDFKPMGAMLSAGYTPATQWLRLRIRKPSGSESLVLRVRPSYLDDIQLFEPKADGKWRKLVSGDRHAYNDRERAAITLGFDIHPPQPESTYYLRLETTSASLLNVEALSYRSAQNKDLKQHIYQMLYLGVMLWLLFWALNDYTINHQPVTLWFLLYQGVYILFDLSIMGYVAPFLGDYPEVVDKLTSFLVVSVVFVAILFHRALFRLYQPPRYWLRSLDLMAMFYPLLLIVMITGNIRPALQVNAIVILALGVLFMVLAMLSQRDAAPGLRILRAIFIVQFLSLLGSSLPLLGVPEAVEWNLHAMLIQGLISGLLMFLILHLRSRQIVQTAIQATLNLNLTHQSLELERKQKEEQNRFMAMLTHELKTPVAVVQMALSGVAMDHPRKNRIDQALRDLNAIIERCQQVDQLEQGEMKIHKSPCQLNTLVRKLADTSNEPNRFELHCQATPALITDSQLLQIILGNLFNNALKYAAPNTPIAVEITQQPTWSPEIVSISVENEVGPTGYPDLSRLFHKYYRSPNAHKKTGAGLGLYLSQNLAERLGGKLGCEINDDKVRFSLWIPL